MADTRSWWKTALALGLVLLIVGMAMSGWLIPAAGLAVVLLVLGVGSLLYRTSGAPRE